MPKLGCYSAGYTHIQSKSNINITFIVQVIIKTTQRLLLKSSSATECFYAS